MNNQEEYEKLYESIKKEGIYRIITNEKQSLNRILNDYDEKDVIICMYLIAIDDKNLESVKLNVEILKNKFKSFFIEKNDILYNIYIKKLLTTNRFKKIIFLNLETEVKFDISTELLITLIENNEIKLLKILCNNLLFDNNFILSLLYYYKYKKPLSNSKLIKIISTEKEKIDLNQLYHYDYYTFLSYSCEKSYLNITKFLIEQGVDINKENKLGETPIFFACRSENVNIVKHLVEKGTNVNKENNLGETPLFIACEIKSEIMAKFLIQHGAEVNKEDNDGETPLFIACEYGNLNENLVKILVEHGAHVNKENKYGRTPLFYAIENGNENIVKCFIQHGADINKEDENGNIPLYVACKNGKESIVKYLIDQGAEIDKANNKNNETPLMISCIKGYENIVKFLIENGADINKENKKKETPLLIANKLKKETIAKVLIENGAKI